MLLGKLQQQEKGVAVGGMGVGTRLSLVDQTLREERLQKNGKVGLGFHGHTSHLLSIRSRARPINSGQADKYQ
jgi:hypothetical protein